MNSPSVRAMAAGSFVASEIMSFGAAFFLVLARDVPMRQRGRVLGHMLVEAAQ